MKSTILRRILSFVLVMFLVLAMPNNSFAAEVHSDGYDVETDNTIPIPDEINGTVIFEESFDNPSLIMTTIPEPQESLNAVARSSTNVVPSNGSIDMYPTLLSYTGFTRDFYVSTESSSTSGALLLYLYNPSGKLVSHDWLMGINDAYQWTLFLPSSGQWHLWVVAQGTTADVNIQAKWMN